ncbi:hypothetical protein COO60DRAFT_1668193 [Scenedesmus sp. NREL 46B-D3]|nr:hypothetical protein COO60DRAFT_1668193 [Scenedesmus sp. NREL 46B-D3]
MEHAASLPASWGSGTNGVAGFFAANQLSDMACVAPAGLLHAQQMPLEYLPAAPAANAAAAARPSASHSPSSSSGGQLGDEYLELAEQARGKKTLNKGALAQKRFRERQKERMRQNEHQVAELTQQLAAMQREKERLESRARLLEQVVSLNLTHEARLHTNKQQMLLEELAQFVLMLDAAAVAAPAGISALHGAPASLHALLLGTTSSQLQQQQQADGGDATPVEALGHALRTWTVATMTDTIFPQYIARLQQLLHVIRSDSSLAQLADSAAAAHPSSPDSVPPALQQRRRSSRREMTDRHALFSHYYWAIWCLNGNESWRGVMQQLQLSRQQLREVVDARSGLLTELQRVAAEWQKVLPTLALQLLQVPKEQWHTVAAVQAMVDNLAAEREAVVAFLHTIVDEVLTPLQEGQLEASSYPWCPDVWTITGHAAEVAAATGACSDESGSSGNGGRGSKGRKQQQQQQQQQHDAAAAAAAEEDPLSALAMGQDVLQPLMPFMTAFQLLRAPVTARGAGLRLKRALLLDPFKTVVPAAAFPQPAASEVSQLSLLDAHCGSFQQVMLWDWLTANLPGYLTLPRLNPPDSTASATPAAAAAAQPAAACRAGHGARSMGMA